MRESEMDGRAVAAWMKGRGKIFMGVQSLQTETMVHNNLLW